jgi:monoamine oxidase
VLIIGAGAAGLAAGRVLAAAGMRVAVLEARTRIGGRICTRHETVPGIGDVAVEVGAEFIHGLPPASWNLIREAHLDTYELGGSQLCFDDSRLQACREEHGQTFEILEAMGHWLQSQPARTDLTFAEYVRVNHIQSASAERAAAYVEGFNASDRHIVGIASLARQQQAEDLIQGDRIFHISGGYEGLPRFLCRELIALGGSVLLNHSVSTISWRPRRIFVSGRGPAGESFDLTAKQLLSTLPLGVLQAGAVEFQPPLPQLTEQLSRMVMGCALRVSLVFKSPFWREPWLLGAHPSIAAQLRALSFLFARETDWPTWWTAAPNSVPVITAWAAGPKAMKLSADRLTDLALNDLARIFNLSQSGLRERLVSAHCHDWQADPCARGAYSYVAAGGLDASELMTRPYADSLFFAGEHTDVEGHWGTVHAALNSGLRAAQQILQTRPAFTV